MYATTIFTILAAATTALAAPAHSTTPTDTSVLPARGAARPFWSIRDYKRTCAGPAGSETSCTATFGIDTKLNGHKVALCTVTTKGSAGFPATQAAYTGIPCGPNGRFTLNSGWSGQFGNGNGFSTVSIVDNTDKIIVYAGYADSEVPANGSAVKPDKEVQPHNL